MTVRDVLEYVLVEANKREAPSLLLDDYIYYINKGITQFVNFKYNLYDVNQQIDDDLNAIRVVDEEIDLALVGSYYAGSLPDDYLHILNAEADFTLLSDHSCYDSGDTHTESASRLHSGAAKNIKKNHYFKPSYKHPYFYINGTNIEVRSGSVTVYQPSKLRIDYLRKPAEVSLTQALVDAVTDTSDTMEFPDYVVQEIINRTVALIMEHDSDPRLQTNVPINQTIATPGMTNKK